MLTHDRQMIIHYWVHKTKAQAGLEDFTENELRIKEPFILHRMICKIMWYSYWINCSNILRNRLPMEIKKNRNTFPKDQLYPIKTKRKDSLLCSCNSAILPLWWPDLLCHRAVNLSSEVPLHFNSSVLNFYITTEYQGYIYGVHWMITNRKQC